MLRETLAEKGRPPRGTLPEKRTSFQSPAPRLFFTAALDPSRIRPQDFEGLPAAVALVHNLTRPDCLALVCGSLDNLPAKFSQLDAAAANPAEAEATPGFPLATHPVLSTPTAALPLPDRRLVRVQAFRDRIAAAARH